MKSSLAALSFVLLASPTFAQEAAQMPLPVQAARASNAVLPAGTEVKLRMLQDLTTKGDSLQENDTFAMTVAQDVRHEGYVVIPRGSRAVGRVTFLTSKGMFGKSGKMDIEIEYVEVAGRTINLDGTYRQEGEGNTLATVGGVVLAGIFAGFITGKSAQIPQGRELTAIVAEPVELAFPSRGGLSMSAMAPPPSMAPAPYSTPTPYGQQASLSYGQQGSSPYEQLVAMIDRAAETYAPNYDVGEGIQVASFKADGGALVLKTNIAPNSNPVNVARLICASPGLQSVMTHGGTVAVSFGSNNLRLTRESCGF